MKHIKLAIGILILAPVFVLTFLNIIFCGTDVVYISSDGKWSERQMVYRNRTFEDVVSSFESYKVKCNAPDVKLERLRSRPEWIVINSWVNDPNDVKANVPLSDKYLDVTFGFSTSKVESAACSKSV